MSLWDLENYAYQNPHGCFTQWNCKGQSQEPGIRYRKKVINAKWLPRNSQQEADPPILQEPWIFPGDPYFLLVFGTSFFSLFVTCWLTSCHYIYNVLVMDSRLVWSLLIGILPEIYLWDVISCPPIHPIGVSSSAGNH